jgi:hypothetical protein
MSLTLTLTLGFEVNSIQVHNSNRLLLKILFSGACLSTRGILSIYMNIDS